MCSPGKAFQRSPVELELGSSSGEELTRQRCREESALCAVEQSWCTGEVNSSLGASVSCSVMGIIMTVFDEETGLPAHTASPHGFSEPFLCLKPTVNSSALAGAYHVPGTALHWPLDCMFYPWDLDIPILQIRKLRL